MEEQKIIEDFSTNLKLENLLKEAKIEFQTLEHGPTKTSQQSASIRGVSLDSGAKAMLVRDTKNSIFFLCVLSASKKISWKTLRNILANKQLELATESQVFDLTQCITGAVPPFGSIFGIQTYLDQSIMNQGDTINFNAGLRTKSIIGLQVQDYLQFENPILLEYSE